uniref:Uncharacterized protein AlNc14C290G10224 n=1 Tax=Albugo laibachii Nc14 TaxID=890382 RepID=F0WV79_9STRA|nr:conserved hypothetical protein [Albugo laibachii Nc14]|eukprot:CCA25318.1 conserved hypothetical protein [Albugo laibachii Nc14]
MDATRMAENDDEFAKILASYDIIHSCDSLREYLIYHSQLRVGRRSNQSRSEFYERLHLILDRVFGNDELSRHRYGGWLDYSARIDDTKASSHHKEISSPITNRTSEPSQHTLKHSEFSVFAKEMLPSIARKLAEFLSISIMERDEGSLCQFIFQRHHSVLFRYELDTLPEQSKISILTNSPWTSVLFTQLLQKSIIKHPIDTRNPLLLLTAQELYLFYFLRHPASAGHYSTTSNSIFKRELQEASLFGSISHPFRAGKHARQDHSWRPFFRDGYTSLLHNNPYTVLLLHYLEIFLPGTSMTVKNRFHSNLLKYTNIFLHTLIEFWLRQNMIFFYEASSELNGFAIRQTCEQIGQVYENTIASRNTPLATVQTQTSYMAPSDDLLSSLVVTIIHLLSDSHYPTSMQSTIKPLSPIDILTLNVHVIRRPLYEFLRLVFSRAPIGLTPIAFLAISDVWLAYIQPWRCKHWAACKQSVDDVYTSEWESFVLANFHFYTVLLGAFVQRAKELDFSIQSRRNLLERVLSVYNAEMLTLLKRINGDLHRKGSRSESMDELDMEQYQILEYYCRMLGIECISVPLHESFHRDAERLYDKLVSDARYMEKDTTEGLQETNITRLSGMLRRIFEISDAYVASVAQSKSSVSPIDSLEPTRDATQPHRLTHQGIFELRNGLRLCSSDSATYIGDPMLRPIRSFEIPILVRLLYRLSSWLDGIFGLENPYRGKNLQDNIDVTPPVFRTNLRFLASIPNLITLFVLVLLLWISWR